MTRKERTLLRRWFIAEFDRIMSARDKAEKTYRQERGLRMPSVKQLESAIRMGTEAPCYKRNDIAWDYPGEIYQTGHEMLIPDQIMAIFEKEKTKHDNALDILSALKPRRFWDHQRPLAEASLTSSPP